MLLTLCITGVLVWLTSQVFVDFRDWLDSDTWTATQSTSLTIQPKTSRVIYTYTVGGQEYSSERTHFFVTAPYLDDRHLAWLNTYRQATGTTVYYNPDAPERAVLVREGGSVLGIQWMVMAGYACLVCLLPVILFGGIWWWLRQQFGGSKA